MVSPYLKNQTQLLNVSWGQTVRWDIRFPDAPVPFDKWFPAHGIDRQVASLEYMEIAGPLIKTRIPSGEEPRELSLQFYDDDMDTLRTWFVNWFADISTDGLAIATVKEACKKLYIVHLNHKDVQTTMSALYVFPYGKIQETFNSGTANTVKGFTISFVVAGSEQGARRGYTDDSNKSDRGLVKTITPQQIANATTTISAVTPKTVVSR